MKECSHSGCSWKPPAGVADAKRLWAVVEHKEEQHGGELSPEDGEKLRHPHGRGRVLEQVEGDTR